MDSSLYQYLYNSASSLLCFSDGKLFSPRDLQPLTCRTKLYTYICPFRKGHQFILDHTQQLLFKWRRWLPLIRGNPSCTVYTYSISLKRGVTRSEQDWIVEYVTPLSHIYLSPRKVSWLRHILYQIDTLSWFMSLHSVLFLLTRRNPLIFLHPCGKNVTVVKKCPSLSGNFVWSRSLTPRRQTVARCGFDWVLVRYTSVDIRSYSLHLIEHAGWPLARHVSIVDWWHPFHRHSSVRSFI